MLRVTKVRTGGSLQGEEVLDGSTVKRRVSQDITPFIDEAARNREIQDYYGKPKAHYRKFATIPDVVAIAVKEEYGIDIHDPEHSRDRQTMKKFREIIERDYRYLVENT